MQNIVDRARATGANEDHLRPVWTAWLAGGEASVATRGAPPPRKLIEALPALRAELEGLARVASEHPSSDGSRRLLIALAGGTTIEAVLLQRVGLCVSTQAGCAVGCRFCKTGEDGLLRQLSAGEIVAQVALARRRAPVERVVLMGMGEPAHNLEAVLEALLWLAGPGRLRHKHLVFSTVGDRRAFERLRAHPVKPALALSLHTTKPELRAELLPRAPRIDPAELVALACEYSRAVTWPLQVQWTLLEGVNDGDDEVERLAELLRGERAIVNLIPWNPLAGYPFRRPDPLRARDLVRALKRRGVLATIRRSGGQDVDGACGQLRSRALSAEAAGPT
jgi:23S rRNA (adenine2503-C2)-methyltransferase